MKKRRVGLIESVGRALVAFGRSRSLAMMPPTSPNSGPQKSMPDWAQWTIGHPILLTNLEIGHVDAFEQVPIVNAAVRKLAEDQASISRKVYKGRGPGRVEIEPTGKLPVQGGNLADLLEYGNRLETGRDTISKLTGSIVVSGNGYLFMEKGDTGPPAEIASLPGHLVRPVPGPNRTIMQYDLVRASSSALLALDATRVIQFPSLTLRDEHKGKSWLEGAKSSYEAQYFALLWLKDFYRKGGILAGVWKTVDGAKRLEREEAEEWLNRLRAMTTNSDGTAKRWDAAIVQDLEWVTQGMKLNEMELDKQLDNLDARILRVLGVPPTIMGLHQGTRSLSTSSDNERAEYWLSTQASLMRLIDSRINRSIAPFYGDDIWVEGSLREVPSVRAILINEAKGWGELTGVAILGVNEAREQVGFDSAGPEYDKPHQAAQPVAPEVAGPPSPEVGDKGGPSNAKNRARLKSDEQRDLLRAKRKVSLDAYRARWEEFVVGRLKKQREHALAAIRTASRRNELTVNGKGPIRLAVDPNKLVPDASDADKTEAQKLIEQLLRDRGTDALKELAAQAGITLEAEIKLYSERARQFITEQVDRAISIPDETTRKELRMALAKAVEDNASVAEAAARLQPILDAAERTFDARENEAMTIARTETLSAYNFASMEAFRESEVVSESEWLTSRTGKGMRHSEDPDGIYAASDGGNGLDGQVRTLGDYFDVGGTPMLYPGDPGAPPGETCNCVCTLIGLVDDTLLRKRIGRSVEHFWNEPAKLPRSIEDRIKPKALR